MSGENERMQILAMIESGQITVNEGLELLNSLDNPNPTEQPAEPSLPGGEALPEDPANREQALPGEEPLPASGSEPQPVMPEGVRMNEGTVDQPETADKPLPPVPSIDADIERWRGFWWIPFWIGAGVTVLGGLLMYLALQASGFGFWFACAWFPFLLGVLILAFAAASRYMRWLHVRIQQKSGEWPQRISISFPLPLSWIAWLLRTFGKWIPNMGNINLDQMVLALEHATPEAPFYVDVDEGGERVQVFIG
ncbi:MAG: SHOCT-like domain-containing protein [Omnitrophica WOR_2 bacterium]